MLSIVAIVTLLSLSITPLLTDLFLSFLLGTVFLILGMGLFSLGAEISMTPIGAKIGTALTKTKNLPLILCVSFVLGVAVKVAEPDLQMLSKTVPHIETAELLVADGAGVGLFLAVCMLRIFTGAKLRYFLLAFYGAAFLLAAFADVDFLGIAFDTGGVTTGPMTVPFVLSLGVVAAHTGSDAGAESDSFGLVAMVAMFPLLSIQAIGFAARVRAKKHEEGKAVGAFDIVELWEEDAARITLFSLSIPLPRSGSARYMMQSELRFP